MKFRYNEKEDILYISLTKGKYDRTVKLSDTILLDKDSSGALMGIEILDAKEQIRSLDTKNETISFQTK